jgi:hypothetical protein
VYKSIFDILDLNPLTLNSITRKNNMQIIFQPNNKDSCPLIKAIWANVKFFILSNGDLDPINPKLNLKVKRPCKLSSYQL